ncbi:unnamed protein product [Cuscuta campestris]|uniref:Retrotransposon gag domain-containing protein n=1 Tax=Cuscuta campestris TaxID=132261 RepID=A0A484LIY2_9ASTE|nr:unnamed protein product [Cuscuta campestris]
MFQGKLAAAQETLKKDVELVMKQIKELTNSVEIPTFEGRNDPEKFSKWLAKVEDVFILKDVPEDKKVKLVVAKFQRHASTWWASVASKRKLQGKAKVRTWEKLRKLLIKRFSSKDHIHQVLENTLPFSPKTLSKTMSFSPQQSSQKPSQSTFLKTPSLSPVQGATSIPIPTPEHTLQTPSKPIPLPSLPTAQTNPKTLSTPLPQKSSQTISFSSLDTIQINPKTLSIPLPQNFPKLISITPPQTAQNTPRFTSTSTAQNPHKTIGPPPKAMVIPPPKTCPSIPKNSHCFHRQNIGHYAIQCPNKDLKSLLEEEEKSESLELKEAQEDVKSQGQYVDELVGSDRPLSSLAHSLTHLTPQKCYERTQSGVMSRNAGALPRGLSSLTVPRTEFVKFLQVPSKEGIQETSEFYYKTRERLEKRRDLSPYDGLDYPLSLRANSFEDREDDISGPEPIIPSPISHTLMETKGLRFKHYDPF